MKEYTTDQFSPFKIDLRFEKAVRRGSSNALFLSYLFHSSICNYLCEGNSCRFVASIDRFYLENLVSLDIDNFLFIRRHLGAIN